MWIVNDNERVSLGTIRWPVLKLRYTLGIKGPLGGDFDYHKLVGSIRKDQKMGFLGKSLFKISAGYIFSRLPYPLLENHIGNESPFYIGFSHNLMDYFEFSSDRWVSIKYRHHFEGLWLNRVPLLKKLKWRLTGSANVLWGGMREENLKVVPPIIDANGNEMPRFQTLNEKPYIELGYGIENIFKIFRVDAFHRLTYLENPDTRKFGVKFSMQFML